MKCHIRVRKESCGRFVIVGRRSDGLTCCLTASDERTAKAKREEMLARFEILPRRRGA